MSSCAPASGRCNSKLLVCHLPTWMPGQRSKVGAFSDMANVTWAKHAVFEVVLRDMEWSAEKKLHEHPRFVGILGVVLGAGAR
jgi:hypothetical protein